MNYRSFNSSFMSIKEMPLEERPREKIRAYGSLNMTDAELITILLGSGIRGVPVQEISDNVLKYLSKYQEDENLFERFMEIKGIGEAQASILCASIELGRRLQRPLKLRYFDTQSVYQAIRHYGDRDQEHFLCIMFNGALEILSTKVITIGLIDETLVTPREVFSEALKMKAAAIVIAHNHPSGNLQPSSADLSVTEKMIKAGKYLGIKVIDHLIFSDRNYYSINENGDVWFN